jgi:hypothetical protein
LYAFQQLFTVLFRYGLSKSATHHLVQSLAVEGSGLPKGVTVVGTAKSEIEVVTVPVALFGCDCSGSVHGQ